jgi:hypothetical protein
MKLASNTRIRMDEMQNVSSKSIIVWSLLIALLATVASILGLSDPHVYSKETLNWATQAKGQDIGNLFAIITLLVSGYLYAKGSSRGGLVWLGTLFYLVYAYIVYSVAAHFNYLFLVYVGVLGLSIYAILFNIGRIRSSRVSFPAGRKLAAWTLLVMAALFGMLWLSELIPALLQGSVTQSLKDAGLWVNPIHVIDLSVVLPGFALTGYWLLKERERGFFFAAPWLTFSVLMGSSIVAAMVMMNAEGFANTIPPMVMVSTIIVLSFVALWRYLRRASS